MNDEYTATMAKYFDEEFNNLLDEGVHEYEARELAEYFAWSKVVDNQRHFNSQKGE
tara:strand:- start:5004 stop:5171 length:168 start_codon:yes stop_codon:yes gene_type:complete